MTSFKLLGQSYRLARMSRAAAAFHILSAPVLRWHGFDRANLLTNTTSPGGIKRTALLRRPVNSKQYSRCAGPPLLGLNISKAISQQSADSECDTQSRLPACLLSIRGSKTWFSFRMADGSRAFFIGEQRLAGQGLMEDQNAVTWRAHPANPADEISAMLSAFDENRDPFGQAWILENLFTRPEPHPHPIRATIESDFRQRISRLPHSITKGRSANELLAIVMYMHFNALPDRDGYKNFWRRLSFVQQSCTPNTMILVPGPHRQMTMAIKTIHADEALTASYLRDRELIFSTTMRREIVGQLKGLICMCARCTAPADDMRVWICKSYKQPSVRLYDAASSNALMRCDACQTTVAREAMMTNIANESSNPFQVLLGNKPDNLTGNATMERVRFSARKLSRNHFITQLCRFRVLEEGVQGRIDTPIYQAEGFNLATWLYGFKDNPALFVFLSASPLVTVIDRVSQRVAPGLNVPIVVRMIKENMSLSIGLYDPAGAYGTLMSAVLRHYEQGCLEETCAAPAGGQRHFCSTCVAIWYCSDACQRRDQRRHKTKCKAHVRAREAFNAHNATY